jgi:hypothetical protein
MHGTGQERWRFHGGERIRSIPEPGRFPVVAGRPQTALSTTPDAAISNLYGRSTLFTGKEKWRWNASGSWCDQLAGRGHGQGDFRHGRTRAFISSSNATTGKADR